MLFHSIFRNVNVTLLYIMNTPQCCKLHVLKSEGGGGEFGPLFLNFLDPPLTVSRSEPSIMLRNFYLAYLGYLTQLCLGGGEFDNVTQNLGGEFSIVWDRWV